MKIGKLYTVILLLLATVSAEAQKIRGSSRYYMPRDMIRLRNGDAETGKIVFYDSTRVRLQKIDCSEKTILRKDIDTITGLSYFTPFFTASMGYLHWKGLVDQRQDTLSKDAVNIQLKYGYMRRKHFAANVSLAYQGGNGHSLFHGGLGIRGYFLSNYVKSRCFYLGLNGGYNFPRTNMNRFFNLGWCMGYEFLVNVKHRFFIEYNQGTALKYDPQPVYFSWNGGMRFSIEYSSYYKKLNAAK